MPAAYIDPKVMVESGQISQDQVPEYLKWVGSQQDQPLLKFLPPSTGLGGTVDKLVDKYAFPLAAAAVGAGGLEWLGAGGSEAVGEAAGAASYGGAGDFASSVPGMSVSASDALGMSGAAASALGVPDPATGAATPTGAPATPGAAPAPTGTPAPGAAGGGLTGIPQVDSALQWMKQNASWLAPTAVGAAGLLKKPTTLPNEQQLSALGAEGAGVAKQLISQYQSGQLQPGQQASLDQLTQQTKNQIRQYFASIHQSDSTAAMQAEAQVDQQALQMKQQMLDQALAQGLQAIGVAQGPLNTIAQYQLGQDQALRQAFGTFAGAIGTAFGRQAGSTATPTPTGTPSQPTAPVTSVPAPVGAE